MTPYCQYVSDTCEFYLKITDKWSRILNALFLFFSEMSANEKNMIRSFKEVGITERRRKEVQYGAFQSASYEYLRTLEIKEKNHINFCRYIDSFVLKVD